MAMKQEQVTFWQPELIKISIKGSFRRLDPRLFFYISTCIVEAVRIGVKRALLKHQYCPKV